MGETQKLERPLLQINVKMNSQGHKEVISVYKGDIPRVVAEQFAAKHPNLVDAVAVDKLEREIKT